ncbi:MAG: GNAT family N-acetyltransferase [Leptolyngbya foveolarum]|uniref:GNAT family N-acetyltransferase n=1 Tax=Leptolyngbya foveolarum TaxID=47253 RepID=A0A2W4UMM7_9CYAN|nr:MAG: GNAT family N-acetyltransferase [Leptolyngbya foveolarum]
MEIIVREFLPEDIEALTELYNHYILETAITFDLYPYMPDQRQLNWMSHYTHSGRHRLFVAQCTGEAAEAKNQVVGYASSSQFHSKAAYETSVETSIYLNSNFAGNGVGSQLYEALFSALSKEDVHRAYAGITLPNETSMAIHRKFGFEQAALYKEVGRKFGRYWDVMWLEKAFKEINL